MHWFTNAFDSAANEQAFCVQQSRATLNVSYFGNAVVICIGFIVSFQGSLAKVLWTPTCGMALLGMMSALPTGRTGNPTREHQWLYWIGVPNVIFGCMLWCYLGWEPEPSKNLMVVITDTNWSLLNLSCLLVMLSQHLLVFPF